MFQNWIKFLLLKCAGSALKNSATQVRVSDRQIGKIKKVILLVEIVNRCSHAKVFR